MNIPDANLKAAIESALGRQAGATITTLTRLDASGEGVADLTGLEQARGLQYLDLSSNPITDISILTQTNFPNLEYLDITDTWVRDFSALDGGYWTRKFYDDPTNNRLYICSNGLENWDYHGNDDGAPLGKIDLNTFDWIDPAQWTASDRERIKEQLEKPTCAPVFTLTGDTTSVRLVVDADADLTASRGTPITYVYRYRKSGDSWPDTSTDTKRPLWTGGFVNPPPGEDGTPNYQGVIEKDGGGEYTADITGLDPSAVYHFQVFGSLQSSARQIYPPGSKIQCWSTSEQTVVDCPGAPRQTGGTRTVYIPTGAGERGRTLSALSFPGKISFSEVMVATDAGTASLPQWIELCNASKAETVNLYGWHLEVEGRDTEGEQWQETLTLKELPIPPGETALLVTSEAPNTVDLPKERIYNLFEHHWRQLQQHSPEPRNIALGQEGFSLKLSDPYGAVSDVAGNLDGEALTADAPAWALPPGSTAAGDRPSLFRLYNTVEQTPLDGSLSENWVSAAEARVLVGTYWGSATDRGNPGHRGGWAFPQRHLSFSELMLTSKGGRHSLPQWIELYNTSEAAIDLRGWTLKIEARDADGDHRSDVFTLESFVIPSKRPVLIASSLGRGSLPRQSVYVLDVQRARNDPQNRNMLLGQVGFFLKLSDPDGIVIDIAGNLDGNPATADKPKWELPDGRLPNGERTSLTRRYYRGAGIPLDGKLLENWDRTADLPLKVLTYYGKRADIGTPGHTGEDGRPPGKVSVSELMLTSRGGLHSLSQWIELYNASEAAIDLRGWTLKIEARDAAGEHRSGVFRLKSFVIPPGQTGLIVTWYGRSSKEISSAQVYTLYPYKAFARNKVLGQRGFFLELSDPEGAVSDTVGNLDGDKTTADDPAWELPAGKTAEGARTSLMRRYHEIGMPLDGSTSESWERAADLPLEVSTYWGKATDIGSPGWPNTARVPRGQQISFSELMIRSRVGRSPSLPQWIELYNASETRLVNLRGWHLEIEARDTTGVHQHAVVTFDDVRVPPNGTVLLVTSGHRGAIDLPRERTYLLRLPTAFAENKVLGSGGFFLKLSDAEGVVSDTAGNLDGDKTTTDEPTWELPSAETPEAPRVSLMRRYYHVAGIPLDGRSAANWVPASRLRLGVITYYGWETDIGNPGYKGGGPLPVALSSFRADRTDTGLVMLKWTTESEKDNAGFHILRSQTRTGRFVKINPKLIAGGGTTSQRSSYTWPDTTAQPNVVYYYRLEDVSFSGKQQELATVRLRGDVSPKGKLVTTWSRLKRQNSH